MTPAGAPGAPRWGEGAPGAVLLGDRYRLGDPVATGGMGTVYRAVDQVLNRPVAVKVLKPELAEDPTFVERFRREARAAAALSHPNVAAVYDYGELGDRAFIVMELVESETLAARIARGGPLPWAHAFAIGEQVARALAAAHAHGLVHRDVKPANILLGAAPGPLAGGGDGAAGMPGDVVKVTDFGIARAAQAATLTSTGVVLGSANYVAPEQAQGGSVGPAADLYALGCVLFEMVTDQTPYTGASAVAIAGQHVTAPVPNPRDRRPDLPGPAAAVIMRAMHKEPARRFESAAAMAETLAGVRALAERAPGESTAVLPPVPPAPTVPLARRAGRAGGGGGGVRGTVLPGSGAPHRGGSRPAAAFRARGGRPVRSGAWVRAAAAVVAVAVALVLLAGLSLRRGREAAVPAQTTARPATGTRLVHVPDVRQWELDRARAALEALGFQVLASRRSGTVTGMRPRPGRLAPKGSTVSLLVAKAKGNGDENQNGDKGD